MIELFVGGHQIATYSTLSSSGNANGIQVLLGGIQTLGSSAVVFRLVVRQVNSGQSAFQNGQMVDIYNWPSNAPVTVNLNPQHDQFQGRASSGTHQIFTSQPYVIDLNGFTSNNKQYGPGLNPPRNETLAFSALMQAPPPPPCFVAGTPILTPKGWRDVASLAEGDLVETLDHGPQPILWRHERTLSGLGDCAPVRLKEGLLGCRADVLLSPHHRVLLAGPRVELHFHTPEVLVQVRHLLPLPQVERSVLDRVTYVHLLFERHQIICADGASVESLLLGPYAVDHLLAPNRLELLNFSFGGETQTLPAQQAARRCLKGFETGVLIRGQLEQNWPSFFHLSQ